MNTATVTVPVSVDQIAVAIRQMSHAEQHHLLQLVPDLQKAKVQAENKLQDFPPDYDELRKKALELTGNIPLPFDAIFLDGLTFAQYDALSEEAKDEIWDRLGGVDLFEMEQIELDFDEEEVISDALLA